MPNRKFVACMITINNSQLQKDNFETKKFRWGEIAPNHF